MFWYPVSQDIWLPHFITSPVHNILVYSTRVCKLCLGDLASHKETLHPLHVSTEQIASLPRMGDDSKEALGDGKEVQEKRIYDKVYEYLTKNTYSTSATKCHYRGFLLPEHIYVYARDSQRKFNVGVYICSWQSEG